MHSLKTTKFHLRMLGKVLILLILLGLPLSAASQGIELSKTVVTGDPRVVGLGGAYTSIAEGLAGVAFNPASLGNRNPTDKTWWTWDAAFGLSFHPLENTDYENDGHTNNKVERQRSLHMGLSAQINWLGLGWTRSTRHYSVPVLNANQSSHEAEFTFFEHALALGFQLPSIGLALGATGFIETTEIAITNLDGFFGGLPTGLLNDTVATTELQGRGPGSTSGIEIGALHRPLNKPYRFGATLRIAFNQTTVKLQNKQAFDELDIRRPTLVKSPSHLRVGASYRWGESYNRKPSWSPLQIGSFFSNSSNSPSEPTENEPQAAAHTQEVQDEPGTPPSKFHNRYILLSTDIVVIPAYYGSQNLLKGPEGFSLGRSEQAGESWNIGFHSGIETVPLPGWLKMRFGNYFEPSRFTGVGGRFHMTGGIDAAFPHQWFLKKVNAAPWLRETLDMPLMARFYFDIAKDYLSLGVSIGVWR